MISEILRYSTDNVEIDRNEVLRYARTEKETDEVRRLVDECINEFKSAAQYKACARIFDIDINGDTVDFQFSKIKSEGLCKFLGTKPKAVIFAATCGAGVDRLIKKYSLLSPAKALIMSAVGSAAIESWCDIITSDFDKPQRRFSPGYGDLALEFQADIFRILEAGKHTGITLGENLFMTPTKSVTAIVGTEKN